MQTPTDRGKERRRGAISLSFVFHAALLVILIGVGTAPRFVIPDHEQRFERIARIEVAGGSHAVQIELPKSTEASHVKHPVPDKDPSQITKLPIAKTPPKPSGGGSPVVPHHGDGTGAAARGNGADAHDVRPAFPVFSPRPPVTDRALLPATEQKIVVDVEVDALGAVVGEKLMKGMGNKLDQIVLDIVKTWRFQPATVDGKPVPTEAELIFPFNQSYPIADS
jgi:TonB family protein